MRWSLSIILNILFPIIHCLTVDTSGVPRYFQNAVYDSTNDRILYIGGTTATANTTSDVYSLDLSTAFSRSSVNISKIQSVRSAVSDATAAIDGSGNVYILGGLQNSCDNSTMVQFFAANTSTWAVIPSNGVIPGPRRGARAVLQNNDILYLGGKSLPGCLTSQYYYNTLYRFNTVANSWSVVTSTNPPIAQAEMTMTAVGGHSILVTGGEAASSSAKATWVGMTQFGVFDNVTNTWAYVSDSQSTTTLTSRSGHSAVYNGSHTFLFGGAIGSTSSTPDFLSMRYINGSLTTSVLSTNDSSSAPTASLYGHSAIMTKNGIMVLAFGLLGSATSTSFNTQIYLYDTVQNRWLDSYDPTSNPAAEAQVLKDTSSLSTGSMVAAILVPVVLILVAAIAVLSMLRTRRARARRLRAYPINRLGTFSPEDDYDHEKASASTLNEEPRGVHLPPWAAMHACQARSQSPPPNLQLSQSSIDQLVQNEEGIQPNYDVQDVQFACPLSPRNMTFTAPRLQLRVVNPDHGSERNSLDVVRSMPELVEVSNSGLTTTVPITITNEDDLEVLRSQLANSPMIGNISDQLAGLGLVIREDVQREPETGNLIRFRTITRQSSNSGSSRPSKVNKSQRKVRAAYKDFEPPRLSIVSDISPSLDLDSMLAFGSEVASIAPAHLSSYNSPEFDSYSPYLDSPCSSVAGSLSPSLVTLAPHEGHETPRSPRSPSPVKRLDSWSSNSSRTGLLRAQPSTTRKGRVS